MHHQLAASLMQHFQPFKLASRAFSEPEVISTGPVSVHKYADATQRRVYDAALSVSLVCRHMLNVTWERKDLSFNSQGFLSNPSMVIIALDRERTWDKVAAPPEYRGSVSKGTRAPPVRGVLALGV